MMSAPARRSVRSASRWIAERGVSRGTSTSRRSSLRATPAARWIRLACPDAGDRAARRHRARADHVGVAPAPSPTRRARTSRAPRTASRRRRRAPRPAARRPACGVERAVAVQLPRDHLAGRGGRADADLDPGRGQAVEHPGRVRRPGGAGDAEEDAHVMVVRDGGARVPLHPMLRSGAAVSRRRRNPCRRRRTPPDRRWWPSPAFGPAFVAGARRPTSRRSRPGS